MIVDQKLSKRRSKSPNFVSGVFLKSVFFLDQACLKSVIVGIFESRGNSVGIVLKGRKEFIHLKPEVFNQLIVHIETITKAFDSSDNNNNLRISLDSGEDIVIKKIFGKRYAAIFDGERTLSFSASEWTQFINCLPCVTRQLRELFICEDLLRSYIISILASSEDFVTPNECIPHYLSDRLFDEVNYFKVCPK